MCSDENGLAKLKQQLRSKPSTVSFKQKLMVGEPGEIRFENNDLQAIQVSQQESAANFLHQSKTTT